MSWYLAATPHVLQANSQYKSFKTAKNVQVWQQCYVFAKNNWLWIILPEKYCNVHDKLGESSVTYSNGSIPTTRPILPGQYFLLPYVVSTWAEHWHFMWNEVNIVERCNIAAVVLPFYFLLKENGGKSILSQLLQHVMVKVRFLVEWQ